MDNGLRFGGALTYETSDLQAATSVSASEGYQVQGGLSLKRFVRNWEFGGGIVFGAGQYDHKREVMANTFAEGDQDLLTYGAEVRAGYLLNVGNWYLKPALGLGVSGYDMSSYKESGSSGAELAIDGGSELFAYIRPEIEIGGQFTTAGDLRIRPTATLAVTQLLGDATASSTARLISSPSSVAPFDWSVGLDRTQGEMALGIEILNERNTVFSLQGFGQASEHSSSSGVAARLSIVF